MVRLLVIKPSSLGDVIHGLPALALIRKRLGNQLERVTWVVNQSFHGLLELAPGIDNIVDFPRQTMWQRGVLRRFFHELRSESYDVAIDFQGLLRSGIMARASGAPRRIGFADGRECSPWFYTERIAIPRGHAVLRNFQLADRAFPAPDGISAAEYPDEPLLNIPEELAQQARKLLPDTDGRPLVAIGHSSRWSSKNWPTDFFAKVMDIIQAERPDTMFWMLGATGESDRACAVAEACKLAQPVNLCGKTSMRTLVALLAQSNALLTNDSGPMHMAAALNTPTVALFGSTDPALTGPYGAPGRHRVFTSCCGKSPCFKHECPFGPNQCALGTAPDEVAQAVLQTFHTH